MHTRIIELSKAAGLTSNEEGICYGFAQMTAQAILANDLKTFGERLMFIKTINPNDFLKKLEEEKNNLSPVKPYLDVLIFLQGIDLHFQPGHYSDLFEEKAILSAQNVNKTWPLLQSKKLEEQKEPLQHDLFCGAYDKKELECYLKTLEIAVKDFPHSLALTLNSSNHSITIGYDAIQKIWIFTDIDQGKKYFTSAPLMVNNVMNSFGTPYVIFSTELKVYARKEEFEKFLLNWKNQKEFEQIHEVNSEKVNRYDNNKATLIYIASQNGDEKTIKNAIQQGGDVNTAPIYDKTPLEIATHNGHLNIVNILLENKADPNKNKPIIIAILSGHFEIVNALLKNGANPNTAIRDGTTVIMLASRHLDIVKSLLQHGADPNLAKYNGATPLYFAAQDGNLDVVNTLLQNGANPNQAMSDGRTPLLIAASKRRLDIVKALLQKGADPNQPMRDGRTVLLFAAQNGSLDIVKTLLNNQAKCNCNSYVSTKFLLDSVEKNRKHAFISFLKKNNSAMLPDKIPHFTELHAAAFFGNTEIVKVLLAHHIYSRDQRDDVLSYAKVMGHDDIVRIIEQYNRLDTLACDLTKALETYEKSAKSHLREVRINTSQSLRNKIKEFYKNFPEEKSEQNFINFILNESQEIKASHSHSLFYSGLKKIGVKENKLSKSRLALAIDEVLEKHSSLNDKVTWKGVNSQVCKKP